MPERTQVLVVDDHRTFAGLLASALNAQPDFDCVGTANTVEAALRLARSLRPDLVVMDVQLGDEDGIALTAQLTREFPELRVAVLTAFAKKALMHRAVDAGACALLPKDGEVDELLLALRCAKRGEFFMHPGVLVKLVREAGPTHRLPMLTRRECQVLQLLATARDADTIARELGISVSTCRGYVKNLLLKMGAHTQLEAVVMAARIGLVRVETPT